MEEIFKILIEENNLVNEFIINDKFKVKNAYLVINSNDFDNKKQNFIKRLEEGKKSLSSLCIRQWELDKIYSL
ncbi:hypothetical protein BST91_01350 [Nonlabens tegetincola]|nr:hypothetical protein BST91_01350 [Nonlabens tegetincola]